MPAIYPFRATRPVRETISLVSSRNYESYDQEEVESRLKYNPFSFLHVLNPGFKYHKKLTGKERFKPVKNRFEEFKEDGILKIDEKPAFYVHQIVYRDQQKFTGIIGACHAHDYLNDHIKKHEDTLQARVELFTDYLNTVRFNAEPVLICHETDDDLQQLIDRKMKVRPEYEFATTSREAHYLWVIDKKEDQKQIQACFEKMPDLYIADGHHRIASSANLATQLESATDNYTGKEAFNYIMSYFISEDQLGIQEFNRLVKDLNGLDKDAFLIKLDEYFRIENRGDEYYKPHKPHHFSMYLDGEFYSLYLRKDQLDTDNALDEVDAHILYKFILKPILGIEDLKKDDRIKYVQGQKDMAYVKSAIDQKKFAVGFGMMPTSFENIKHVADQSLCMPPKSTYIDPKLRSGITVYEF